MSSLGANLSRTKKVPYGILNHPCLRKHGIKPVIGLYKQVSILCHRCNMFLHLEFIRIRIFQGKIMATEGIY